MKFPQPPARRRSDAPAPDAGTHKERSVWFRERAAFPFREADPDPLVQYRIDRNARGASPHPWQPLGPDNFGGRFTSLAVHPLLPDRIFAGAAGGGVWRTIDGGDHWQPLWSHQETLSVGSLAIDPRDPDRIFCGTGEANLSSDSYPGAGFYLSENGGDSWKLLVGTSGNELFPRRIGSLAVKTAFNPRTDTPDTVAVVYVGSVTHSQDDFSGLVAVRLLPDSALSVEFQTGFISGQNYWVHSVLAHPSPCLFAAVQAHGGLNGIWRSDELHGNFRQLHRGLPQANRIGRVSLAFAPSHPRVIYALAENLRGRVLGVFRSSDLGESWRCASEIHFRGEAQASYNNCIAVDPHDHNTVYCGLMDMHRSRDGGRSWKRISDHRLKAGDPRYIHSDCHAIAIPRPGRVLVACDGGIYRSDDGGDTWRDLNQGLQTTMFYDIDAAPSDAVVYGGGTQDNGVLVHTGEVPGHSYQQVQFGDGGWTLFDPDDAFHLWTSVQHMKLYRTGRGRWFGATPEHLTRAEKKAVWQAFLAMESGRGGHRPRTVFAGSTRMWRTRTDGRTWRAVSRTFDGSVISAIEVASADARFVYAGTTKGGIFRSMDGGDTWSEDLSGPELPGRIVTRIEAHPRNPRLVALTVGLTPRDRRVIVRVRPGFGELGAANSRFTHVFFSRDAGETWAAGDSVDKDRRCLPDVPLNSIAFETRPPFRIFLAGDAGVFQGTLPAAALPPPAPNPDDVSGPALVAEHVEHIEWTDISGTLPNAPVTDLVYHSRTAALFASTFGCGIWQLRITD